MSDCINWEHSKDKNGYGLLKVDGKTTRAHRAIWEAANSIKIPAGLWVLHKCDNPSCVNPEHLYVGTPTQNMQDRKDRGRNTGWKGRDQVGMSNSNRKLTLEDVAYIRENRRYGMSKVLAAKYNTSAAYIRRIWSKQVW